MADNEEQPQLEVTEQNTEEAPAEDTQVADGDAPATGIETQVLDSAEDGAGEVQESEAQHGEGEEENEEQTGEGQEEVEEQPEKEQEETADGEGQELDSEEQQMAKPGEEMVEGETEEENQGTEIKDNAQEEIQGEETVEQGQEEDIEPEEAEVEESQDVAQEEEPATAQTEDTETAEEDTEIAQAEDSEIAEEDTEIAQAEDTQIAGEDTKPFGEDSESVGEDTEPVGEDMETQEQPAEEETLPEEQDEEVTVDHTEDNAADMEQGQTELEMETNIQEGEIQEEATQEVQEEDAAEREEAEGQQEAEGDDGANQKAVEEAPDQTEVTEGEGQQEVEATEAPTDEPIPDQEEAGDAAQVDESEAVTAEAEQVDKSEAVTADATHDDESEVAAVEAEQVDESEAVATEAETRDQETEEAGTLQAEDEEVPQEEADAEDAPQDEGQAEVSEEPSAPAEDQTVEGAGDVQQATEEAAQEVAMETEDSQKVPGAAETQGEPAIVVSNEEGEESAPPPPPHLPSPERSHTSIEGQMSTSALNVVWSFGLNRNVPVLNLSDGVRSAIMYPCAHVGIMYDFKNNKQHILQAHLNPITCTAASQDKRWLVTGDVGPDAMVNIWDTYTGIPIQTMFDPNPSGGVVAVALTPDSRYLATLSALPVQTLAIWDWTVDGDVPICSADLKPEFSVQNFICFDPTDIHHVVTNSETQVLFYQWEDNLMKYFAPPLTDSDFNKPVGRYSQSIFQKGIARALTATSIGNLVVWDNNKPLSKFMDVNQSADKKPLKIIRIHDKGINVLTTTDSYIVVGDTAGHVKFFDQGLRLIYWYQDFHIGACTAVSFAHMPDFVPVPSEGHQYPSDATKQAKPFLVRDFVVGSAIAVYGNISTDGSKFKVIHREHDAAVHALAAHPKLPIVAMGSYSGLLKLWNYRTKEVVASRMFEKAHIHTCAFDPKGFFLAVGCANGTLYLVDSVALLDQLTEPFRYAQDCITHIAFSHNSTYFATADAGFAITAFKRQRREGRNPYVWHGRYRSHYKTIKDLSFGVDPDTNKPKLMSLGEDRMLIEYDLHHMGKTNNHMVPCAEDRIEQSAFPQCMTWYPPITKENFLLTANDQFKLKCYNSTTKMCRKTVLGPTYGSPMKKMMVVPAAAGEERENRFLAYITDDKVGLHILPATGNPHLAMALIAHPSGVSNLTCSYDGNYLFTAGGPDFAVHMWEINIKALRAQAKLGGEDLIPFYGLLDGGRDGEMFAELEDLFYYAQLRHQGINSTETRQIGNRIPITEVPYVMRAMGYYPSEQEIEDMLNEIKYEEYVNSGHYQEDIDLGSFIKLYVNHRPAFGLSADKLLWAFKTLAESPEMGKGGIVERGDLLMMLQKQGEHMTEYELAEHLTTLLGFNQEGGSCEQEVFDAEQAGNLIADVLPYDINAEILINEILGFSMNTDPPGVDNTKDVYKYSG